MWFLSWGRKTEKKLKVSGSSTFKLLSALECFQTTQQLRRPSKNQFAFLLNKLKTYLTKHQKLTKKNTSNAPLTVNIN